MSSNIPNTFQCPNDFVDRLLPVLSDLEVVVLTFATRKILGWEMKRAQLTDRISLTQFETTGRSRQAILRALRVLHDANILIGDKSHAGKTGAEYELNLGQRGAYRTADLLARQAQATNQHRAQTVKARQKLAVSQTDQCVLQTGSGQLHTPPLVSPTDTQNPLSKPTTKPRGTNVPPAVKIFQQVRAKFPPHETWDTIAESVGEQEQALQLWRDVLVAYAAQGWNRQAVDGPLDYFKRSEIPKANRKSTAQLNTKGQRAKEYWDQRLQELRAEQAKHAKS